MRLVANALAMMQGGAWCGAVSGAIDAVVELEAHDEVLAALAVTLAVSAAILSAQRCFLRVRRDQRGATAAARRVGTVRCMQRASS